MASNTLFPSILPGADEERTPTPADVLEGGECPWCDAYEGDNPAQHASKAHPDAWDDYKDDDEE